MYMSLNTVRTHTHHIFRKLGVHSTVEAVALALRAGWTPRTPQT
jgi:DNA-binding CsgD family transcriptional regulator